MYVTLHGLVLREVKYKESSKILTVLTEEEGKITAEAKGALRKGSKCAASAQSLVWSEMTLFERAGRYTLTEGSVLEDFAALRAEIDRYALGCYFAELLEAVSDEDSPSPQLLRLGLNALFALSRGLHEPEHIKTAFELRLMALAGFAPAADRCVRCGKREIVSPRFSLTGGALHCTECPPDTNGRSLPLDEASLAALRYIGSAEAKKVFAFSLEGKSAELLGEVAEEYVRTQLERGFRTLDYWRSVKG